MHGLRSESGEAELALTALFTVAAVAAAVAIDRSGQWPAYVTWLPFAAVGLFLLLVLIFGLLADHAEQRRRRTTSRTARAASTPTRRS